MPGQSWWRSWKALRVSLSLGLLVTASLAATAASWQVESIYPVNDGTGRVLWVQPGTTDSNGVYSGDIASVWSLNAQGVKTAIGPSYGPYQGWQAQDIEPAPDGTTRLEWVKAGSYDSTATHYSGDTVSVWTLNSAGTKTIAGPSYGPYSDWHTDYFDVAKDSTVHLYWYNSQVTDTGSSDAISVWRLNANGTVIAQGPTYGPFTGWHNYGVQTAPDGSLRLQWINSGTPDSSGNAQGDLVSIWTLNTNGTETNIGPTYGRYAGWTASFLALAPDNTARIDWIKQAQNPNTGMNTGDMVSVWTLDSTGHETAIGPTYGPYSGWQNYDVQVAPDNTSRLFWVKPGTTQGDGTNTGDTVSLWALDSRGNATAQGPAYGPFAGWTTNDVQIAPDGTSRLGWSKLGTTDSSGNYSGDTNSVWTLNASGKETAVGATYGPYQNWSVDYFYPPTSSLTYLVWQHGTQYGFQGDEFSVWSLNAAGNATLMGPNYGPF